MLPKLIKPQEFQRDNSVHFPTLSALRFHITHRRENGMLESGAVVESPLGLRIDPERFPEWLMGKYNQAAK